MRGVVEASAFGGLALALHVALWAGLSGGGAPSAGDGGGDAVTLQASDPVLAALVAEWDSPPAVPVEPSPPASAAPTAAPPPSVPAPMAQPQALPQAAPTLGLPPSSDAAPEPGQVPPQRSEATRPTREPAAQSAVDPPPVDRAQPPSEARPTARAAGPETPRPAARPDSRTAPPATPQRRAAGQGARAAEGRDGTAEAPLSQAARNTLMAEWGGRIRAQIMRRSPRAPAAGVVTLQLDIGLDGALRGVELARSSGNPGLDRAALGAVRAVGRFPPAPEALGGPVHRFTLPLRFD